MLLIILFTVISFIITYIINYLPKIKGCSKPQKLLLYWGNNIYHIHHWITFSLVILILLLGRTSNQMFFHIFIGISIGCIIEGFLFKDFLKIKKFNNLTN